MRENMDKELIEHLCCQRDECDLIKGFCLTVEEISSYAVHCLHCNRKWVVSDTAEGRHIYHKGVENAQSSNSTEN